MKKALWPMFLLAMLGCAKHDASPAFTSVEGKWTYTTPDSKIKVLFELTKITSDSLDIKNQSITVDGTSGNAAYAIQSTSLTAISYIRINANDSKLTYPYNIKFTGGVVSSDFKTITFASALYTWPTISTTQTVNSAKVTRQ